MDILQKKFLLPKQTHDDSSKDGFLWFFKKFFKYGIPACRDKNVSRHEVDSIKLASISIPKEAAQS